MSLDANTRCRVDVVFYGLLGLIFCEAVRLYKVLSFAPPVAPPVAQTSWESAHEHGRLGTALTHMFRLVLTAKYVWNMLLLYAKVATLAPLHKRNPIPLFRRHHKLLGTLDTVVQGSGEYRNGAAALAKVLDRDLSQVLRGMFDGAGSVGFISAEGMSSRFQPLFRYWKEVWQMLSQMRRIQPQ